jgi:acetyl-CoA synthetase
MSTQEIYKLFFTSETTGMPKGIVHTHGGFPLKISHDAHIHFYIKKSDVFFWPVDIGWIAGALIIAATLMQCATIVCYDGATDFPDWSRMAKIIERYKVTQFGGAPTMIRCFAADEFKATAVDPSSLRLMITGRSAQSEPSLGTRDISDVKSPPHQRLGRNRTSGGLGSSVIANPIPAGEQMVAGPGLEPGTYGL